MEPTRAGDLVTFDSGGPQLDAIVFDLPSSGKVVIAVVDRERGPVLRTVDATSLSERAEAGASDKALQLLIRRTPAPSHVSARGAAGSGKGRPGHARASMHRTTGK